MWCLVDRSLALSPLARMMWLPLQNLRCLRWMVVVVVAVVVVLVVVRRLLVIVVVVVVLVVVLSLPWRFQNAPLRVRSMPC